MSENASLARPYAKAIFELAQESDQFDAWSSLLAKSTQVCADEQFTVLMNDPRISSEQLSSLMVDLLGELPQGGNNLINLLVQNDRLSAIAEIQQQYTALVAAAQKSVNAEVVTAYALNNEQRSALESALEVRLGLKVNLDERVDSTIVGGAIVKAGDLVIDGSALGRIEKMTSTLMR